MTIDPKLLTEAVDLMIERMLYEPAFCGSMSGRRLQEIKREITVQPPKQSTHVERRELVNRTVTLSVNLDNALTVAVEKSGLTRDVLIEGAIATLIAENRLT